MRPIFNFSLIFSTFVLSVLLTSCLQEDEPTNDDTLLAYINLNENLPLKKKGVIACATGNKQIFNGSDEFPINILFLPEENATDFRYYETDFPDVNLNDYQNFKRKFLAIDTVFYGFMKSFIHENTDITNWGIVTFMKEGAIHLSDPIHIKYITRPTEFIPTYINIDLSVPTEPYFSWDDGIWKENVIYFQAITNANEEMVSATYTNDKYFQFYDLSNVVLNVYEPINFPTINQNKYYKFSLMGISEDNWVNLISEKGFIAR